MESEKFKQYAGLWGETVFIYINVYCCHVTDIPSKKLFFVAHMLRMKHALQQKKNVYALFMLQSRKDFFPLF
jgi:hypothetical protein